MVRATELRGIARMVVGALALLAGAAAPARSDILALAVGIDGYKHEPKLEGAADDARDIAEALTQLRAKRVVLLLNEEATRIRIEREWAELIMAADPGDTVVLTFAGHGSQERSGPVHDAVNTLLLAGFDRAGRPGLAERINSNEINAWFKSAGAQRQVRILFVADTCYSGSMVRSADARVPTSARAVPAFGLPDLLETAPEVETGAGVAMESLPHVTFIAATEEDKRIQAVTIGGRRRGALSYAMANAIRRAADGNGRLTRSDLERYVRPAVRQLSEGRQIPKVLPASVDGAAPILEGKGRGGSASASPADIAVRVALLSVEGARRVDLTRELVGAIVVEPWAAPDLLWDARDRAVLSSSGDVVAFDVEAEMLRSVVDRWHSIAAIKRMALEGSGLPLDLSMEPTDERHPKGREVAFRSEPVRLPHLTAFNLAPEGTVQFLYPKRKLGDEVHWPTGKPYQLRLAIVPPFGADHLVVIASKQPLTHLHRQLDRVPRTADLPRLLVDALQDMDHQIGIHGLYTYDGRQGR